MSTAPELSKEHLSYCFSTVINALKTKSNKPLPYPSNLPDYSLPLFITWKVTQSDNLRGCIGSL